MLVDFNPEFWKSETALKAFEIVEKITKKNNGLMKGTVALNHTQSQTSFMPVQAMFIPNQVF